MNDNDLYKMEARHNSLLFTESSVEGLYYATAPDDNRIVLFTDGKRKRAIVLTKLQAEKLAEELPDMLCMIGRGKLGRRNNGKENQKWI